MSTEYFKPDQTEVEFKVPWTVKDTWLGIAFFVLITAGILIVFLTWDENEFLQGGGLLIAQILYLGPVIYIMKKRGVSWTELGFRKFDKDNLVLGFGLLIGTYALIVLHNAILFFFDVTTQGEQVLQHFASLDNPLWLIFVGAVLAPLVEETFFRGFVFSGFRQRFGWNKAGIISAVLFSIAHMQLITLIPTFILGYFFAYLYHRSNSLWPGIIFHFLINSMAFCVISALSQIL